ncbi:hypothetical protein WR25_13578 [Diploscapter pachys]|uniref:ATP-grasp domain-containing protein n=1 Tax=Diploscapter pachys TaxID=2018661 RepID=A0A2A2KIH0_9BILA|nr:hypothetical protein WR25_13578 [Diploscapter pachys]
MFAQGDAPVVLEEFLEGEEASLFVLTDGTALLPFGSAQDHKRIVAPTVKAMREEGMPFSGVLYAGLMLTRTGPKLIEYNARFGDPECQVLMMRFQGDLLAVMLATAEGRLAMLGDIALSDDIAMTVVLAAAGYPGTPKAGGAIRGIDAAEATGAIRPVAASSPSPPPAPTSAPPATRPIAA